jgi:hypothetical protein
MAAKKKKEDNTIVIDQRQPHPLRKQKVTEYPEDITEKFEDLDEDVIAVKAARGDYTIVLRDPYQHAFIEGPKLPAFLTGSYTSYDQAKKALDLWLNSKG